MTDKKEHPDTCAMNDTTITDISNDPAAMARWRQMWDWLLSDDPDERDDVAA